MSTEPDPAFLRPIRRKRLWEEVAERLEGMIAAGIYPRGTLLPSERELMRLFGTGRPSIREALFALARMGLVEISTGERATVTSPTPESMIWHLSGAARHFLAAPGGPGHFQDARLLFEAGIARVAANRATAEDLEALDRALRANVAARGDTRLFEQADVSFHYVLATATRNPIFLAVHDAIVAWLTGQRRLALRDSDAETVALEGHEGILDAVRARDADRAGMAMERHLEQIATLISRAQGEQI